LRRSQPVEAHLPARTGRRRRPRDHAAPALAPRPAGEAYAFASIAST
jgi:hypothetical protein